MEQQDPLCGGAYHLSPLLLAPRTRREAGAEAVREALHQGPEDDFRDAEAVAETVQLSHRALFHQEC
jgi:hypothetical protein